MNRCESKILAKLQIVEEILNIPPSFCDNRVDVLGLQARMAKSFLSDVAEFTKFQMEGFSLLQNWQNCA
jgi:hypothetical protein